MTTWLLRRRAWVPALLAGMMPLGTVATCDYTGSGGTLFVNDFDHDDDDVVFVGPGPAFGGGTVIVEDRYDEVIIVEDSYYVDPYYGAYCDPYSWWGCY